MISYKKYLNTYKEGSIVLSKGSTQPSTKQDYAGTFNRNTLLTKLFCIRVSVV